MVNLMKTNKDISLSSHGLYSTEYHISWITKYRRSILTPGIKRYLYKVIPKIISGTPDCELEALNILDEHVHMVLKIPPKYAVKDIIGKIKGISSSKLEDNFEIGIPIWSPGYFVRTVGVNREKILEYVRNQ
jgi:putative transposase